MSIYDKKLYIKKTDGNIQTANLYTDKNDVGDNYLTFKYNGNTVYAVLSSNGDIDFNVSYNHNLYKINNTFKIVWKTDEYRMSWLYPSTYRTMTELPNDRDWIEFVKYRKNLSYMFDYCQSLTKIPQIDTRNVIDMRCMFNFCVHLTTIPQFDTRNVTNMFIMFKSCPSLTTVPLFNTQNVTDMGSMFYGCSSLTELPIFDIRNVKNIRYMIFGTQITHITFKNKPANLEVTPEILGKPDVQITFI
jgi:bacterial surface protein 26-residue repeat protein